MIEVDNIARGLIRAADFAKRMSPLWDRGKVHIPVICQEGRLGSLMPGRGLYLDCDLKYLGINKKLSGVYEKTPVRKLTDFFKNEHWGVYATGLLGVMIFPKMWPVFGAVASFDGIINARGNALGFDAFVMKQSITTVANTWYSLLTTGGIPSGLAAFTAIPGGAAYDNTTAGVSLLNGQIPAPTGGNKAYLQSFEYTCTISLNEILLVDLLVAAGSISATVNTAQTVNSAALTRYTSGIGVIPVLEVTTAFGATGQNVTMSYTNQGGTAGQALPSQAMTVSAAVQRLQPGTYPFLYLAVGDYGVRSVQTLTFSAANTTGACALELVYPLAYIPGCASNMLMGRDMALNFSSIQELVQTSTPNIGCLTMYVMSSTTTSGILAGTIRTCQG